MNFSSLLAYICLLIFTFAQVPVSHTSPLYNLVLSSSTHSLNNAIVFACHEGAALESLCALPDDVLARNGSLQAAQFRFNVTQNECDPTPTPGCTNPSVNTTAPGVVGQITWTLFSNGGTFSEPQLVHLSSQGAASNVAFAIVDFSESSFPGSDETELAFDDEGRLGRFDNVYTTNGSHIYGTTQLYTDRWWICGGKWFTYTLDHLVWVYGDGRPTIKGCDKVVVNRVWI